MWMLLFLMVAWLPIPLAKSLALLLSQFAVSSLDVSSTTPLLLRILVLTIFAPCGLSASVSEVRSSIKSMAKFALRLAWGLVWWDCFVCLLYHQLDFVFSSYLLLLAGP